MAAFEVDKARYKMNLSRRLASARRTVGSVVAAAQLFGAAAPTPQNQQAPYPDARDRFSQIADDEGQEEDVVANDRARAQAFVIGQAIVRRQRAAIAQQQAAQAAALQQEEQTQNPIQQALDDPVVDTAIETALGAGTEMIVPAIVLGAKKTLETIALVLRRPIDLGIVTIKEPKSIVKKFKIVLFLILVVLVVVPLIGFGVIVLSNFVNVFSGVLPV